MQSRTGFSTPARIIVDVARVVLVLVMVMGSVVLLIMVAFRMMALVALPTLSCPPKPRPSGAYFK